MDEKYISWVVKANNQILRFNAPFGVWNISSQAHIKVQQIIGYDNVVVEVISYCIDFKSMKNDLLS